MRFYNLKIISVDGANAWGQTALSTRRQGDAVFCEESRPPSDRVVSPDALSRSKRPGDCIDTSLQFHQMSRANE